MPKYLSGRAKRVPQDQLSEDRYQYLGLEQAEPNLSDPLVSPSVPSGAQYQLVAVPAYPGKRYWVPVGGGLVPGAITIFDEDSPVSSSSSITQLNFVGAAVTANVSVQSPSGHPGIAATVTVIPVSVGETPPNYPTPNEGELWWESDTGDLYIYYNDGDSAQWVMTNAGGRGLAGDKGQKGEVGSTGLTGSAGAKGDKGEKGQKGDVEAQGNKGQKGEIGVGQKGQKGEAGADGTDGDKGQKGEDNSTKGQKGEAGVGQKGQKGEKGTAGSGATVTISDNAPGSAAAGDMWWDSDDFDLHVYYGDGDSNQWVSITSNAALKGQKGEKGEKGEKGQKGIGEKGQKGEVGLSGNPGGDGNDGDKGQKGEVGADNSTKGQKGETGADNSTKGQKGEAGADNSTKGDKGQKGAAGSGGNGFVNAADYGLDASATDGTNVTAINNAITALGTNGGTIFFPGGMFLLNASINLGASNNSIRFVGSGHQNYGGGSDNGGTVLRRDQNNEFFNITNSRAIHFVGITFKGGAANGSGGNSGISGGTGAITVNANAGCQGHLYENLVFHGIKNCLNFNGLSDSIIRGCRFRVPPTDEGTGQFIALDDNGSERLDQIRISDCVADGSPDGSALNNQVDGITIKGFSNTIFVTNCSFIRLNRSFYLDSSWTGEFLYFQNVEAERASSAGFVFDSGGSSTQGNFITIDNCFSCTNESHGIQLSGTLDASVNITNCNVRDNKGHGILVDSDGGNTSIVNPVVAGNSKDNSGTNHGIFIGNDVDDVYIAGGRCGGDATVRGTGTQGRGILINGSSHSNIRIIGTNVSGNQNSEGIGVSLGGGTSGNKIQFNSGSTVSINS